MIVEHLNSTELLLWGTTLHLIIDWLLQNEWMAVNKTQVRHPAGTSTPACTRPRC